MTQDSHDFGDDALLLHALADGELDAAASLAMETRLACEPALASQYARIQAVKRAVAGLERPPVSDAFYARMAGLGSLVSQAPSAAQPVQAKARQVAPWFHRWRSGGDWRAAAALMVMAAALASGGTYLLASHRPDRLVEDAVADGHRRSLLAVSPVDVASSDRHTVRPWFEAKLGVAPPAPDLVEAGFPLVGGRVEVIDGRAVPTLVYRYDGHLITLVAIPQSPGMLEETEPSQSTSGGYNARRWTRNGFLYWAVSDLDAAQLDRFVASLRAR